MKKKPHKLTLNRETLRNLNPSELQAVVGEVEVATTPSTSPTECVSQKYTLCEGCHTYPPCTPDPPATQ